MRESNFSTEITQPRPHGLLAFQNGRRHIGKREDNLGTRLGITLLPQLNGHHLQFAILYFDYDGKKPVQNRQQN